MWHKVPDRLTTAWSFYWALSSLSHSLQLFMLIRKWVTLVMSSTVYSAWLSGSEDIIILCCCIHIGSYKIRSCVGYVGSDGWSALAYWKKIISVLRFWRPNVHLLEHIYFHKTYKIFVTYYYHPLSTALSAIDSNCQLWNTRLSVIFPAILWQGKTVTLRIAIPFSSSQYCVLFYSSPNRELLPAHLSDRGGNEFIQQLPCWCMLASVINPF